MAALERAADLSIDEERQSWRLIGAAEAAWRAGLPDRATALLERANPITSQARGRAELDHLRGVIQKVCGVPAAGCAILMQAAADLSRTDPDRAVEMLLDASEAARYAGDLDAAIEAGRRAERLGGIAEESALLLSLISGVGDVFERGTAAERAWLRDFVARAVTLEDPRWLVWAGTAAALVGGEGTGSALQLKAVTRARASAEVSTLSSALEASTFAGMLEGRYGAVAADATEGLRLAREAGLRNSACHHLATLAWVAAVRGEEDECRSRAAQVADASSERGLGLQGAIADWALALLDLGLGRPTECLQRLMRLSAAGPGASHPFIAFSAMPDLVESAVRAGRPEDARPALAAFERFSGTAAPPWALGLLARCRAMLTAGPTAEAHFAQALAGAQQSRRSFDRARTELLLGEHLRRARRRAQARDHLQAALAEFERLGAAPWEERAIAELRASGRTARKRDPSTVDQLTAQELQIARFVATGATNREVAAQLFLSKRTVDYHLRGIFAKLAISSRSELMRLDLDASLEARLRLVSVA
jgi:ATP/maltotriose-dependent transcriptional regulator MalT